jgi:hypothetical protein
MQLLARYVADTMGKLARLPCPLAAASPAVRIVWGEIGRILDAGAAAGSVSASASASASDVTPGSGPPSLGDCVGVSGGGVG